MRIALLEDPAWPTLSLGCYWLFCANLYWLHALKYAQDVSTNSQTEKTLGSIKAFWALSPVRSGDRHARFCRKLSF